MGRFSTHSGRGRDGGRGRGRGRGNGRSQQTSNAGDKKKAPQVQKRSDKLTDPINVYAVGSSPSHMNEIIQIEEVILRHFQKTLKNSTDLVEALKNKEELDFDTIRPAPLKKPVGTGPNGTLTEDQEAEHNLNKEIWDRELDAWFKRRTSYKENAIKAYATIFGQCSDALQERIKNMKSYETAVVNNPIELLKAIQTEAMSYHADKYDMAMVREALKGFLNMFQKDGESLSKYTQRMKTARDILTNYIGEPLRFPKIIEASGDQVEDTTIVKHFERFTAYLYVAQADKKLYGSLFQSLENDSVMHGKNIFPDTVDAAEFMLSQYRAPYATIEDTNKHSEKGRNDRNRQKDREDRERNTSNNDSNGNDSPTVELTFQQSEGRCFVCGSKAHYSTKCKEKSRPKSEWYINKVATQHAQTIVSQMTQTDSGSSAEEASVSVQSVQTGTDQTSVAQAWGAIVFQAKTQNQAAGVFSQAQEHMRNWVCLDSASTVNSFCNPKYVTDIRKAEVPLHMVSNTGHKSIDQMASTPVQDDVWFDEGGVTNILSLFHMTKRYRVVMDSEVENAFIVYFPKGPRKFKASPEGLYRIDMEKDGHQMTTTTEENKAMFTNKQIERAKQARSLLHAIGFPTLRDLKAAIKMNSIVDCPVTIEDIDIAETVYGPDIATIKGKTTRSRPSRAITDVIEIPPELIFRQQQVDLCVDIMFVNELPFLTTISKKIMLRTCQDLASRSVADIIKALNAVFRTYEEGGFNVKCIFGDQEFKPVVTEYTNQGRILSFNGASAQEHVPEAERNNRTIQERARAAFHALPYQALPKSLIKRLVMESCRKLNFFPPRGGISPYYSPREIVTGLRLHYKTQCQFPLLSYVQAHEDRNPKNTPHQRSFDALYIKPTANKQGGHEVYNIHTGEIVTRSKVTSIPITPSVITAIEVAAKKDKQKGLVFRSKHGVILYDSSWTAGVDYTHDINEEDDVYNDEDYTYESDQDESLDADDSVEEEDDEEESVQARHKQEEPESQADQDGADSQVDEDEAEDPDGQQQVPRRSARERNMTERMKHYKGMSNFQEQDPFTYTTSEARVLAILMMQIIEKERGSIHRRKEGQQFVVTYSLNRALQKFGEKAKTSTNKEMSQMLDRECFRVIKKKELTDKERKRAVESLLFLTEKKDGTLKSRFCANGSTQRTWMSRDDVSSPTVSTESTLLTAAIEAKERRHVVTCDIPNAFIQTTLEGHDTVGERTIMKIRGQLVDILCEMEPTFREFVEWENGKKVLYVLILKAIYGLLVSAMLFYRKLRKDLEEKGFIVNPYDPCVANKMVNNKQLTVSWHVDDLKASHAEKKVIDEFVKWIKEMYGSIGTVKVNESKIHDYLGMKLDYTKLGAVIVDMVEFIITMIKGFPPEELETFNVSSPWTKDLFVIDPRSKLLPEEKAEQFHTTTAQGIFVCKRGRPDISPAIAFLSTRVRNPSEEDWKKLVRMMKFLKKTLHDRLTLEASNKLTATWYVDASFAVHPDFRSHTGAVMTLGKGAVITMSRKQGLNTRSSTEAELVGADDVIGPLLWARLFLQEQGYAQENTMMQDNQSAMKMEANGRASAGKRSRHINIRYFFIKDMIDKKHLSIEYCPTDKMFGDYMTKPLVGQKFNDQRNFIMNLTPAIAAQLVMVGCFQKASK